MNEPQLSAEMEKRLLDLLPLGLDDWIVEDIKHFLATALEEERERIKRCLMPVVDIECNHEEGSTPVEDNLGQYHIASGVCCKCGTSVLDWKQNEPQLSAEMEELREEVEEITYSIAGFESSGGEIGMGAEEATNKILKMLATALEEQKIKSYDEGFLAGKMYARMTTIDEVESWLVEEPEHFVSSKNPANMGKNNIKAKIKNELRAELRAKLEEMGGTQ